MLGLAEDRHATLEAGVDGEATEIRNMPSFEVDVLNITSQENGTNDVAHSGRVHATHVRTPSAGAGGGAA